MTDNEISRALALAIGWREKEIRKIWIEPTAEIPEHFGLVVLLRESTVFQRTREFDYRDPAVILPLVIYFEIEVYKWIGHKKWRACTLTTRAIEADSYHKAAALAIIEMQKGKV